MSLAQLIIPARFNGPVASGNGGYSAGRVAALIDAPAVTATLRAAIPLDAPMHLEPKDGGIDAFDGDALILEARPATLALPAIKAPSLAAAVRAADRFRGADDHVLPTCFVCGPARPPGDGLRIFTDWLAPEDNPNPFPVVAAPWTPEPDLADASGRVAAEFLWAAIDCPGAFALDVEPILLGRMTAAILDRPRAGQPLIAAAWRTGEDRRKHFAHAALFTEDGRLLAHAEQTWILIDAHAHTKS